jgi:hypothetical protein
VIAALLFGCGGGKGGGPVGGDCTVDDDCPTGLCWDFSEHDPLCGGRVCSIECTTDDHCIDAATAAGAEQPEQANCGSDSQCDLVGTGLGSFQCAVQ